MSAMSPHGSCHLYRYFDSDGLLLYIGISFDFAYRLIQHQAKSIWFCDIARIDIEKYSTRQQALHAEAEAIEAEKPIYNRRGKDRSAKRAAAKAKHTIATRERRRRAGVIPRHEYEQNSISRAAPWEALGINRRTWYRNRKIARQQSTTE
jgi:predicted GIY-YIG superfamily endonuclease